MIKISDICSAFGVCIVLVSFSAEASERLLKAGIDVLGEVNDNIFLTSQPHDTVTGVIITPSLSGFIKEEHWQTSLRARLRINKYSDHNLDGNDQFFDLKGRYLAERNIFSINLNHDLDSNLNSTSTDFGVAGRRVNRKKQSITPQYTRLLTERAVLLISYTYSDVDYLDAVNTGFTPYVAETASGSLIYDLTEIDKVTFSLTGVDYRSQNDLVTYQLFQSRIGIEHEFSETLSADFLIGVSRRNSTNLDTEDSFFFGQPFSRPLEIDSKTRGLVLDAGITQLLERGQIDGRISRDNTTNSFGGLDEVNKFTISYTDKVSTRWSYLLNGRFEDITSISSGSRVTDRKVFFFEMKTFYSISKNWDVNGSYRYILRRFKSDNSDDRAPHSNRIYLGLTYNFPPLSTF